MLYTKYERSGPCCLGQNVFWKLHFENLFLDPVIYSCNQLGRFEQLDREPPRDHSCEVWSKSKKRFQRRCCSKKLLTDGRTDARTDAGRRTPDIEGSQKIKKIYILQIPLKLILIACSLQFTKVKTCILNFLLIGLSHQFSDQNDPEKRRKYIVTDVFSDQLLLQILVRYQFTLGEYFYPRSSHVNENVRTIWYVIRTRVFKWHKSTCCKRN